MAARSRRRFRRGFARIQGKRAGEPFGFILSGPMFFRRGKQAFFREIFLKQRLIFLIYYVNIITVE
jgi:hypothetical protein